MTVGPPTNSAPYLTLAMDEAIAAARRSGIDLIDFGVGDPRDETPLFIRKALSEALVPVSSYPKAAGLPELRQAIAAWVERRFGEAIDPHTNILPTLGSKEIIHSLAAYAVSPERNIVLVPDPAYPVYERGARFHGAKVIHLPLREQNHFLPDIESIPPDILKHTALLWLNYPNNPTTALASLPYYERAVDLAREHGFLLASDEAYSEIWFDEPPASVLQVDGREGVVAINTLSKRSCMTGYRSGFLAGDPEVVRRLTSYRASVGVTPQDFVQRCSIAAWENEQHVEDLRSRWATKRDLIAPVLRNHGLAVHDAATFFLWVRVPPATTSASFAAALLSAGVAVSPGHYFGSSGEGFVRLALVPSLADCEKAARRLSTILPTICEMDAP